MSQKVDLRLSNEKNVAIAAFNCPSLTSVEDIKAARKKIIEFIDEHHPQKIVVDFQNIKFFSSEVLGTLVALRSKLNGYGGEVLISAINPQLYRVFKITNLDKIFKFFPDTDSAVQTVKTG